MEDNRYSTSEGVKIDVASTSNTDVNPQECANIDVSLQEGASSKEIVTLDIFAQEHKVCSLSIKVVQEEEISKKDMMSFLECPVCLEVCKPPLQVYTIFLPSINPTSIFPLDFAMSRRPCDLWVVH